MVLANVAQGSAFYVNLVSIVSPTDTFDSNGLAITVPGVVTSGGIGALVVRDMGKTVRVPGGSNGSGTAQRILRKVQRIDSIASTDQAWPVTNGFVGFNDGVGGGDTSSTAANPSGFQTFYIEVGGVTTGTVKWARLTV